MITCHSFYAAPTAAGRIAAPNDLDMVPFFLYFDSSNLARHFHDAAGRECAINYRHSTVRFEPGRFSAELAAGIDGSRCIGELALAVGDSGRAVGLDMSAEQLNAARGLCAGLPAAELTEGDATDLSFEDGTFDGLAAIQTLEYVPDVDGALAEARRVLKPGGKAAFVSVLWEHWRFHGADPELNN
jgi:ubiquinone/menaquinone biosynthesis C-methylase UbiE